MKQKNVVQLLVTYTAILLTPVLVIGLLTVYLYLSKLERNFEALNTKTIETANIHMDMMLESALVVDYQLTLDEDITSFLTTDFKNVQDRVKTLSAIRNTLKQLRIDRDGIAALVVYSRVNDVFIGDATVYETPHFCEAFFSGNGFGKERLFEVLETLKTKPIWIATDDYLIYCAPLRTATYSSYNDGLLFAMIQKTTLLNTWKQVFGSLDIDCAVLYEGENILLQTAEFSWDMYKTVKTSGVQYQNYLAKQYKSQLVGNLEYLFTVDCDHFNGDIAQMIRSLGFAMVLLFLISLFLALRKARGIRDLYVEALEKTESLGDQLNLHVEELNRQLLRNALRGYDPLPLDKQGVYLKNSRVRVLIFRPERDTVGRDAFQNAAQSCFSEADIELLYLYEKDMGCVCILGYSSREILAKAVLQLWQTLSHSGRTVHMGLSSEFESLSGVADAGEQAGTALHYCTLQRENGGIVYYSEISEQEKEKVYYSAEKESQLLRNIRMGRGEKVAESLEKIYQINFKERRLSGEMIRSLLIKMLNTVCTLLDTVDMEDINLQVNPGRISHSVLLTQNKTEAFNNLRDVMMTVCDKCAEQKEGELRRRVITYIGENFRDPDLSVEKMAADFEMSYYHMSRMFNESMQMNFASYIAGLRLEYAKELLRTTACSVEQVAQQSGFLQSGTFIRAFKKYFGVTPGKYREEQQ